MYPCGGDLGHWGNFTWAQSKETYTELAQLLAGYPNVIGVDITNEAYATLNGTPDEFTYHQAEPVDQLLTELGNVVRAAGLPITHSRDMSDSSGWSVDYFTDHLGDFLDFHVYYTPGATDSLTAYRQSWGAGKQLIVGEFGMDVAVGSAVTRRLLQQRAGYVRPDPNCHGAFAWSAWDLAATKDTEWGLFDRQRVVRADIGDPFSTFPVRSS